MITDIVELLIYAAAMAEYRRHNLHGGVKEINAILRVVEYSDRPRLAQ